MKSEDIEFEAYYHKAHHITNELLSDYCSKRCLKDNKEINVFLDKNQFSGEWQNRLSSIDVHRELYDRLAKEEKEKNVVLLLQQIRAKSRQKKRRVIGYRIAASIAVIFAITLLTMQRYGERPQGDLFSSAVSDRYTQPTLVFEGDESVVLTDSGEHIVNKDYGVEKLRGNSLRYTANDIKDVRYNKLIIPKHYTYTVCFTDGTEVILNAGSVLRYPVDFKQGIREVELSGEAFFKVAKADKPFVVRMGKNSLTVYGTQFNVHTRQNSNLEIVLLEGSVGFKAEGKAEIRMTPNQMIICDCDNQDIEVMEVDPKNYILWTENMFVFKSQSLERVLSELSIWYGVTIDSHQDFKNLKLTLITSKSNSLEEILRLVTEITNINIIKTGDMECKTE